MRHTFLLISYLFWPCVFIAVASSHAAVADAENPVASNAVQPVVIQPEILLPLVLQQANERQLAQHPTWLALLHYKRETVLSRFISQVDEQRFFLDINGNNDAVAELQANIKAFLNKEQLPSPVALISETESQTKTQYQSATETVYAQCLFPARWWWLKQQLNLPTDYDVPCPKLEMFMRRVSHDKLFMVFPAMYLNNPGSTFGHTFLRFDNNDGAILLSQTLNYSARVDQQDDIFSYVSKGLFGGYPGFFRARPYFETVQEYSNIENRDIWEYQLAFTPDEIEQLVRHIWEVKGINFDYYFFRENCSYRLLALLDVIRPGMQLTTDNHFPVYAIPVDTVRALDDIGLIKKRDFRASLATQIDDYFNYADEQSSNAVLKLISPETPAEKNSIDEFLKTSGLDTDESNATKIKILTQSYNLLQFYGKSSSKKAKNILALTSELTQQPYKVTSAVLRLDNISPEKGHESIRVAAGYGEQNNNRYIDLKFRPAFHDLLDAPQGYIDGAAINTFDIRFKWFVHNDVSNEASDNSSNDFRLESLSVFNVTSLSPFSRWQKPLSWLLDFRFDRTQINDTLSVTNFISRGGVGLSGKKQLFMPFVLLMGEWNLSSSYTRGYSLLLGLQAGLQLKVNTGQFLFSYEKDDAVSGFELDRAVSLLQWQYNITVNHAVRLMYKRIAYDFYNDEDWSLNYHFYF